MAGLSDYLAQAVLNFVTASSPMPALAPRYLALFTTAPTEVALEVGDCSEQHRQQAALRA
jgi:hypothetical protein